MVKVFGSSIALLAAMIWFAGCSSGGGDNSASSSSSSATTMASAPATQPSIPPDSPFAKIHVGEERDEVFATIGQPTSTNSYPTGKQFIPFHEFSGGDEVRIGAHYKGIGVITFGNDSRYTSGFSVVDIHYDPSESGY